MNTSLKFGLIGGTVLSFVVLFYQFELYNTHKFSLILTPLQLIFIIIVTLLGIKEKKRNKNNEINLRDAIVTGLSINFIITMFQSLAIFIFFSLSTTGFSNFKENILNKELEQMKNFQFPANEVLKNIEIARDQITPFNIAKGNFMQLLLIGLIISLIIAFFQRNKFEATAQ